MSVSLESHRSIPEADLLRQLRATPKGLTSVDASQRLTRDRASSLSPRTHSHDSALLLAQFKSPLILILLAAAGLSFVLRDPTDGLIILTIVLVSGVLGFWQERGAAHALAKLLATVQTTAVVLRDGVQAIIPVNDVVQGDVVILPAGGTPETEFERGIRRFGYLLMEVTLVLVVTIFAINVYFERPVLEAFIFSLALAVGLTPQLLSAVISINLAHGAKRMALKNVIVRRLSSIENLA